MACAQVYTTCWFNYFLQGGLFAGLVFHFSFPQKTGMIDPRASQKWHPSSLLLQGEVANSGFMFHTAVYPNG